MIMLINSLEVDGLQAVLFASSITSSEAKRDQTSFKGGAVFLHPSQRFMNKTKTPGHVLLGALASKGPSPSIEQVRQYV